MALVFTVACGGITTTDLGGDAGSPKDAATSNDSATGTDSSITTVDASTTSGPCPASQPASGSSCSPQGLDCEYGSDARLACNTYAACEQGAWQINGGADCTESQPGQNGCPLDRSTIQVGTACSTQTMCAYPDGVCACGFGGHPPTEEWVCDGPPDPPCPYPRPKLGTACTSVDQMICDYGSCSALGGSAQVCQDGTWRISAVPCPP